MIEVLKQIKSAILFLLILSLLTGLIYPAMVTGIAQLIFPWQANGSLLQQNQKTVGSMLIGQYFADNKYFWGRPSATKPFPYNSQSSSGSNLGPDNPELLTTIKARIDHLHAADPANTQLIPVDLVTSSASGLDPEISPLAADYQIARIAKARQLSEAVIKQLIQQEIANRTFKFLGESRVNVLQLNIALDSLSAQEKQQK